MAPLSAYAKEHGVKYFLISFVDLFGTVRAKIVPATAIDTIAKAGAGFAGFATWLDMTPADSDILAMPGDNKVIQLPWKPEVAWVPGDLVMDGKEVTQNPRQILKKAIAAAAAEGYELKTGVECEYFLISPDGSAISDAADTQSKPCYDQQALMRRYDVIAEICDAMIALGWSPYQNDHEDANGQFEMNWDYDTALATADKHVFFKYMVKSIAEKHGLRATFMPKPFSHLTGNGCHVHASLWSTKTGKNVFEDASGPMGLSETAYHFIGGVLHSAEALCAITNPTVNSYKRINAPPHPFGRHLVAKHGDLHRQQPHAHDPHPGHGPFRAAPRRRLGQPLPAAGRCADRGAGRHPQQAQSGPAARHKYVYRGPQGRGRQEAAAQPAGCAAGAGRIGRSAGGPRAGGGRLLPQAQAR